MSKPVIVKLFVGGIVAVVAGILLCVGAVIAAFASGVVVMNGPDVETIQWTPVAGTTIALLLVGTLAVVGGAIAGLVAWIGALINTAQLEDKLWFIVLLVLGLMSFGFVAMIAYVIAGPDGTVQPARSPVQATP